MAENALPVVITPGMSGHIDDSETVHTLLKPVYDPAWKVVASQIGLLADRPVGLNVDNAGFVYHATDSVDSWWTGSDWVSGTGDAGYYLAQMAAVSFPISISAIRTTGYAASGDGGSALYKRVASEPSHAGKFQTADGDWWEIVIEDGALNASAFGVLPSPLLDRAVQIQNGIDTCNTLATAAAQDAVVFLKFNHGYYRSSTFYMRDFVVLDCGRIFGQGWIDGPVRIDPINLSPETYMIEQVDPVLEECGIIGMTSRGDPTGTGIGAWGGINLPSGTDGIFEGLCFQAFGIEAIILGFGNSRLSYSFFQGVCDTTYITAGAVRRGAATLGGADHQVSHCEFTGRTDTLVTHATGLYAVACLDSTGSTEFDACVFQLGDIGHDRSGTQNRYVGCRWDTNAGHGYMRTGGTNDTYSGSAFHRNGRATNNTYSDLRVPVGGGSLDTWIAPMFTSEAGNEVKFRIHDEAVGVVFHNKYLFPTGNPGATAFKQITNFTEFVTTKAMADADTALTVKGFSATQTGALISARTWDNVPKFEVDDEGRVSTQGGILSTSLLAVGQTVQHPSTADNVFGINLQPSYPTTATLLARDLNIETRLVAATAMFDSRAISISGPTLGAGATITNRYGLIVGTQHASGVTTSLGVMIQDGNSTSLRVGEGINRALWLDSDTTAQRSGIIFGSLSDVNLYRSGADTLKTDDSLHIAGTLGHLGTYAAFFGNPAAGIQTLPGAAVDPATTQALANAIRSALQASGFMA